MQSKHQDKTTASPLDEWQRMVKTGLKPGSKLSQIFEKAGFGGYENRILTLYFEDEALAKTARGQVEPLKQKLQGNLFCNRIEIKIGSVPQRQVIADTNKAKPSKNGGLKNPLQALNFAEFGYGKNNEELPQPVLEAAVHAESSSEALYQKLNKRIEILVGSDGSIVAVDFPWRLQVGGTRGFRELLLPVFHPVFGVPYLPASTLKGAARAWARSQGESQEIKEILGILEGSTAKAAKVEFLDAFPVSPCLKVDVATPQWHWRNDAVEYKPEPHPLLSMASPKFRIGLRPTKPEYAKYIPLVKDWLENALKSGIGSRVSAGYGKAVGQIAALPHGESCNFHLWTQGMYGSNPPSKNNGWCGEAEFRPTAVRGILRYWFRAAALSWYKPDVVQQLEDMVFGQLSKQGETIINVLFNPTKREEPLLYGGQIILEAKEEKYLEVLRQLLILASHLGGLGRGSRRPLHLLDVDGRKYMRGTHWEVDINGSPLEYDREQWQTMFKNLKNSFKAIRSEMGNYNVNPGSPKPRLQDTLGTNAQVWLVKSSNQIPPEKVQDWRREGIRETVRGTALSLLYGSEAFKGERKSKDGSRLGNSQVGGALEIPSFVWIKSIFAKNSVPYQVVTIFGVDQPDRLKFAQQLEKLSQQNPSEAMLVFGQMPNGRQQQTNQPISRPNRPIKR